MRRTILAIVSALLGACSGSTPMDDASTPPGTDSGMVRADAAMMGVDATVPPMTDGGGGGIDGGSMACPYPSGAVEPMALGAVIWPYRWPEAVQPDGTNVPLDLTDVHCTADENIDWSPFDFLLFISFPAW